VNDWQELLLNVQVWLGLSAVAGLPVAGLWASLPAGRRHLLPPPRRRAAPWGFPDVYVALCAFILIGPLLNPLLQEFLAPLYSDRQAGRQLVNLWSMAVALPLAVATILLAMNRLSGTRPYQLGLTTHRWREDLTFGYLVWLGLTPLVLLTHFLALHWLERVPHPFERLAEQPMSPVEWGLIVFLGVVQAPVQEELFFRGVLQPWLERRTAAAHVTVYGALGIAVLFGPTPAPAVFVLAMLPGFVFLPHLLRRLAPRPEKHAAQRDRAAHAVYATGLLFAAFHSGAWPSPIALFVLGLGLGWLARRTQSLTGPLLVHALFNAVASTVLVVSKA
jgi:membrane protease YdiL (CAAX protease family)